MKYTKWIQDELPHFKDVSSAKTFRYIQQAKRLTLKTRMFLLALNLFLCVLAGFVIGYLFGKYTNISSDVPYFFSIGVSVWLMTSIHNKIEDNLIKKEILKLFDENTE